MKRDCYRQAFDAQTNPPEWLPESARITLVHGFPLLQRADGEHPAGTKYGHAWVEYSKEIHPGLHMEMVWDATAPGGGVDVPRDAYYAIGRIDEKECHRYNIIEARKLAVDTGHYGAWADGPADAVWADEEE